MCIVCCHFQLNWNVYVNFDILKGKIKRQSKKVVMVSTHSCMRHHVSHIYKLWMWMGWKQSVKHLSNEMLWNEKATAAKNLINRMKVFFYFIRIKESSHIFFISCLFSVFYIFWKASRSIWKWQTIDVLSKLFFLSEWNKKNEMKFFLTANIHTV